MTSVQIETVVIVGGGIVGLSTAWQLMERRPDATIVVVEKESELARHQSGHNSGVIHAGVYYQPGSLKAEFCRRGVTATMAFCDEEGIAYEQCGKLLVATNADEHSRMEALHKRCAENQLKVSLLDRDELRARDVFGTSGFRLGEFFNGEVFETISYGGDRHMMTVAPTRKHKGTAQIIPELLTHEGSTMVIDPKGENAMITAAARIEMGQEVHVVDPWHIAAIEGITSARFNPLDWLQVGDVDITENAMLLADAIIIMSDGEKFWDEEAKALLVGVILYVATSDHEAGHRHLPRVRDLLLLDGEDLTKLFQMMMASPLHIVASAGARCLQKDDKLLSNVMATVQSHTHFLDSARIRESMSASDFQFEDLKSTAMSIYLVLPADRLNAFSRWLRLMVQQAITVNARNIEEKPDRPVLFVLDELPALGRLSMVEQAYGLMAGFGMQLHGIVQDLSQVKSVYGEGWETFIGNSGVVQYFGSRDRFTAEYFSALCGETTVWNLSSALARSFGSSSGPNGMTSSESTSETDTRAASQRKLAYPDELMRMHDDKQLLIIDNLNPIIARKKRWFEDEALKDKGVNLHG